MLLLATWLGVRWEDRVNPQPTRSYHHGNLKEELLSAAVQLIGEVGPRAFTLREVARKAKVSHNAPYRHFRDKDELLAAIAGEGFNRLADAMLAASAPATDALQSMVLSGRGYVQFALRCKEHFLVMFDYCNNLDSYPEHAASGKRAFQILLDAIVAAQAAGQLPASDPHVLALAAWSQVHGIAKLANRGQFPFASEAAVLEFTDFATRAIGDGLARTTAINVRV
jgi:AcrR family transcriptional regulator